jgi:hypothetical protein
LLFYNGENHDNQPPQVIAMAKTIDENTGIKLMIQKYRRAFRVRENLDFYSEEDFIVAERKFLKYTLLQGESAAKIRHIFKLS